MTSDEVLKLIDAGFTADEIRNMQSAPETKDETVPGTADEQSATSNATHESALDDTLKSLNDTVAGLSASVKAIQDANLKNAHTEGSANSDINAVIKSFMDTL